MSPTHTEQRRPAGQQTGRPAPAATDRLPPHSIEAEAGILGCILLSPVECLSDCAELGVQPEWFYDLRHQTLYHGLTRLAATSTVIDLITLVQWLRDSGNVEAVGGVDYVAKLQDTTPSAAHLLYYLDIVREKFQMRRCVAAFTESAMRIYEMESRPGDILHVLQRDIELLTSLTVQKKECQFQTLAAGMVDEMERTYHRGSAQITGLTTGIPYLDKVLCGIGGEHGNFNVVAARPNVGKTALAMQIAINVALDHKWFTPRKGPDGQPLLKPDGKPEWDEHRGLPVGVFSMEMEAHTLVHRCLFQRARADAQRFRTGFAEKHDFDHLRASAEEMKDMRLFIDDTENQTPESLCASAQRMVREHGIKLFVIDYLQLIHVSGQRFRPDRVQEMAEISNAIRSLGRSLGVPFLVVCQMNRDFEKEPNRAPRLSDLRDCGAIEQDADTVAFLYHRKMSAGDEETFDKQLDHVYGKDWSVRPTRILWHLQKNRYGPNNKTGDLLFQSSSMLFLDYVSWKKQHGFKDIAKGEAKIKPAQEML